MCALTTEKDTVTIRVSTSLNDAVRSIARREGETAASVWRRLVKRGLEMEQRSTEAGR
jgi:hypothetical protein